MSIPRQLARESENRKFKYSEVEKGVGARKYGNSVEWLRDAEIADMAYNLSAPLFPLSAYVDDSIFKLYLSDIGLLTAMYGFGVKAAVVDETISGTVKGALYENLVASCLVRNGHPIRYIRDKHEPLEVEFLVEKNGTVVPIEVKASNSSTASLDRLLAREDIALGYKLTAGNVSVVDKKITIPHYMAMFL
jgi:predicted AAA+ superfamily ATPase